MPRVLSQTLNEKLPGEVLHFDYLFLGDGEDDQKYVFVLKNDFSGYTWLNTAKSHGRAHSRSDISMAASIHSTPLLGL